jgi:hypothetical protein
MYILKYLELNCCISQCAPIMVITVSEAWIIHMGDAFLKPKYGS